jgi:hypothetical protein
MLLLSCWLIIPTHGQGLVGPADEVMQEFAIKHPQCIVVTSDEIGYMYNIQGLKNVELVFALIKSNYFDFHPLNQNIDSRGIAYKFYDTQGQKCIAMYYPPKAVGPECKLVIIVEENE